MVVRCPTCKKEIEFSAENQYRPFCSQRCSTLDLGAWADELYRVPVAEQERDPVNENQENENAAPPEPPPKHHLN